MRETSSLEFQEWCVYLAEEQKRVTKEDFYWAQIALEIARTRAKHPKQLKLKTFIIDWKKHTDVPINPKERLAASKSAWKAILGGKRVKKDPNK
jgi:hypothetical protein